MNETKPKEGLTSADIKKQIEEATKAEKQKKGLRESNLPLTAGVADSANAIESIPERKPDAESKAEPVTQAPEQKPTEQKKSVDFKEWAKKKGIDWTTDGSTLEALYKSDQAFHRKRAEEKAKEPIQQQPTPPPYQQPYVPQPSYAPPVNGGYIPPNQIPKNVIEGIARSYNMTPEDVEKLALFNRDFFEAAMQQERRSQQARFEEFERENKKNTVFREISSDPVSRNPEVAMEFHNVLEQMQTNDPRSFEQDPNAYKRAFDIALQNIARRNLEGRPMQEGIPLEARQFTPPTTPPRPFGQSSGGGQYQNENSIDSAEFAKLPLEEKTKVLERMGIRMPR